MTAPLGNLAVTPTTLPTDRTEGDTGHVDWTATVHAAVNALTAVGGIKGGNVGAGELRAAHFAAGELPSGGGTATPTGGAPYRQLAASGPLALGDADSGVEAGHPINPVVVRIPLGVQVPFSRISPPVVEVVRVDAGDVSVAPTIGTGAAPNPMQQLLVDGGLDVRAPGASIFLRERVVPSLSSTRPNTGLRALLVANVVADAGVADGGSVASWVESSGSTLALPAATQTTAARQPKLKLGAANGHAAVMFDGSDDYMLLPGSWGDLFRNRPNAMVCIAMVATTAATGDRTLLTFSTPGGTAPRVTVKHRDNGSANAVVGGRRLDADASGVYVNAGAAVYPDLTLISGRFVWSASTLTAYRNGVQTATNTAFQTAGSTSDTASSTAVLGGSAAAPTSAAGVAGGQFLQGGVVEVAVYDDNATVLAAWHDFAVARYGEKWHVTGGVE